jgi:hypothetical protein
VTRAKYVMPDGRPVIAIVPGAQQPRQMIAVELGADDALWPRGQRIPGTERRFVLAERAAGL